MANIIDHSYFIGEINLPQTTTPEGQAAITQFITIYEKQLLQMALGYELWKAFTDGLEIAPVPQKWLDLLSGKEFTTLSGKPKKWEGLIILSGGQVLTINNDNNFTMIVGRGQPYDAVPNAQTVTLPPQFVDVSFIIERREVGQLREDEYSVSGSTLSLIPPDKFLSGDTFFYKKATSFGFSSSDTSKQSPIANYVYWHFVKVNITQTAGIGEVQTKGENADRIYPSLKLVNAWNKMIDWILVLKEFLDVNKETYPEWEKHSFPYWSFRKVNAFGI